MKTVFFSLAIMLFSSINAFCGEPTNNAQNGKGETTIKSVVIKTDESNLADLQKMASDFDATYQVKECSITLTGSVNLAVVEISISVTVTAATCSEAATLAAQGLSDAKKAVLNQY
jgi:predicted signal transduction protein with EAL and GGDEF domain